MVIVLPDEDMRTHITRTMAGMRLENVFSSFFGMKVGKKRDVQLCNSIHGFSKEPQGSQEPNNSNSDC